MRQKAAEQIRSARFKGNGVCLAFCGTVGGKTHNHGAGPFRAQLTRGAGNPLSRGGRTNNNPPPFRGEAIGFLGFRENADNRTRASFRQSVSVGKVVRRKVNCKPPGISLPD